MVPDQLAHERTDCIGVKRFTPPAGKDEISIPCPSRARGLLLVVLLTKVFPEDVNGLAVDADNTRTAALSTTAIRAFEQDAEGADGGILVNMSVWESVEALGAYVDGEAHRAVLRRRREWFEHMKDAYAALWWIPRSHIPTVGEAEDRVRHLRAHGPTPYAFTLRTHFPSPGESAAALLASPDDWTCPV